MTVRVTVNYFCKKCFTDIWLGCIYVSGFYKDTWSDDSGIFAVCFDDVLKNAMAFQRARKDT